MEHGDNLVTPDCRAVADILSRIGDKWTVFVVRSLSDGPRRFTEIKRVINGISQRMLTLTLRGLERDGFVTRTVTPSIPPRVDYELTDLGRTLIGPLHTIGEWATTREPAACSRGAGAGMGGASVSGRSGAAGLSCLATGGAASRVAKASSMSLRVTRPPFPVPITTAGSMPYCSAARRTAGEKRDG